MMNSSGPAPHRLEILLAEDNPVSQTFAVRALQRAGHSVKVAANGREALEMLRGHYFDAILMDLEMPEMGGLEASAAVREIEKTSGGHVLIVAMTAYDSDEMRQRCVDAGIDGYVAKPFKSSDLVGLLEDYCKSPQGARGAEIDEAHRADRVFDWKRLLENIGNDTGLLKELAEQFLASYAQIMKQFQESLARGEAPRVFTAAHELRGMTANFTTGPALVLLQKIEALAREGKLHDVRALSAALETEMDKLKAMLQAAGSGA